MAIVHAGMVLIGIALIFWGLPAAHRLKSPFDILAALAVFGGLVAALLGALLLLVPGFFQG